MAPEHDLVSALRKSQIFGALDVDTLIAVAARVRQAQFRTGEMIFSRGDEGSELYIVLGGRVRLSILTIDGREFTFAHAGTGDTFGEIAMLDGKDRTANAIALTDTHLMLLSRTSLSQLMEASPALVKAVIEFVCSRLRNAD